MRRTVKTPPEVIAAYKDYRDICVCGSKSETSEDFANPLGLVYPQDFHEERG